MRDDTRGTSALVVLLAAMTGLVPASCGSDGGDDGETTAIVDTVLDAINEVASDVVVTFDTNSGPADTSQDTTPATADTVADTAGPACGELGDQCVSSEDCCSSWCLQGAAGSECTRTCVETCPEGWECRLLSNLGPDPVSLCVNVTLALCQPCREDADCNDVTVQAPNRCLSYGDAGSFCGINCSDSGADCPDGYSCEAIDSDSSDAAQQCVKDDGVCACNDVAISLGRSTDCMVRNTFGECQGSRVCAEDGLSACDAVAAVAETCDGTDEDCDDQVDEDVPSVPCTTANEFGECAGMSTCEVGGVVGCDAPEAAAEVCNGVDDDCDGLIDEAEDTGGPCCSSLLDCTHLSESPTCLATLAAGCVGQRVDGICNADNVCEAVTVDDPAACLNEVCREGSCDQGFFSPPTRCSATGTCSVTTAGEDCNDNNQCTTDSCDPVEGCAHAPLSGSTGESCYTFEPASQQNVGECHPGTIGCDNGQVIGCQDQQGPATEVCNGADDDCDGSTDEDVATIACEPYLCRGPSGCGDSCAGTGDCVQGFFCDRNDLDADNNNAECLELLGSGDACTADHQCEAGYCNNGFCCNSQDGDCCGSNVNCLHLLPAEPLKCTSSSQCEGEETLASCDVNNVCQVTVVDNPAACASQVCEGPSCSGLTKSSGKACSSTGQCSVSLGTESCVIEQSKDYCNFGCSAGDCTGSPKSDIVYFACLLFFEGVSEVDFLCDCDADG